LLFLTFIAGKEQTVAIGLSDQLEAAYDVGSATEPPIPYYDEGACPHEGCHYGLWWVEEDTSAHKEMDPASEIIFAVKKGDVVECWDGVVVVRKPVRFRLPRPFKGDGQEIPAGEIVYLLTPEGEGFHLVWYHGQLLTGLNFWDFRDESEKVEYEWWVKIENERGEVGWALEDGHFATDTLSTTFYPFRDGKIPKVLGQWDFDQGDLRSTHGQDMEYADGPAGRTQQETKFGTTRDLQIPDINGQPAKVMWVPACTQRMGYRLFHRAEANPYIENAWHSRVEDYTLIVDLMIPPLSRRIAVYQTDVGNSNNADLFVVPTFLDPGDAGCLAIQPDWWQRIAWVVRKVSERETELRGFINGHEARHAIVSDTWDPEPIGFKTTGAGRNWSLEPRRSLLPYFLLFTDNDHETGSVYVNSIQFRSYPMGPEEIAVLGGPTAAGIPVGVTVTEFGICEGTAFHFDK
jgi:hypothetical protein